MSISIHELLAVARESEGVKAVQGDAMLCEKRFAPDTRYMVEFLVLKQTEKFGEAGIYHRYFLTKKAYYEMVELQNRGRTPFIPRTEQRMSRAIRSSVMKKTIWWQL